MTKPILLVGEARGAEEAKVGAGFVGSSGCCLLLMLNESGVIDLTPQDQSDLSAFYSRGDSHAVNRIWLRHPEVVRTNVFEVHPPGNQIEYFANDKTFAIPGYPALKIGGKSIWIDRKWQPELERLGDVILDADPNLIIAFGNTALWSLCGITGVSKLRGTTCVSTHTVSGYKVLVAYHPAAVLRQWELRPTTVIDLIKAPRENGYGDVRRPHVDVWIEPNLEDLDIFHAQHILGCKLLSVDIETARDRITSISFSPTPAIALVVPFSDERAKDGNYWPTLEAELGAWKFVFKVLADPAIPKLYQNGLYDIAFCWRAYGAATLGAAEDSMLLHHALQPESLKGLAYLGSLYTDHGPWKSERKRTTTIKSDE